MKKSSAKKLLTCRTCGKGGFINLKSHRCRGALVPAKQVDVELVDPPNEKKLNEAATEIRRVHGVIEGKTRRFQQEVIYDYVEWGVYFLRAKEALGHGNFEDFLKSATVADLEISERSARNYMNAARNCGLSAKDDHESVEALRKAKALHGKTATELYSLTDAAEPEEEETGTTRRQSKWQLVRSTASNLREQCEAALKLKHGCPKKAFETICARLHQTLEEFSGSPWDIVEKRKGEPHYKEHGDVYEIGS